jgi:hypothetical protein
LTHAPRHSAVHELHLIFPEHGLMLSEEAIPVDHRSVS